MAEFSMVQLLQDQRELDIIRDDISDSVDLSEAQQLEITSYTMTAINWWSNSEIAPASRTLEIRVEGKPLGKSKVTSGVITFYNRDDLPPARYVEAQQRIYVNLHEANQPFVLEQMRAGRKGLSFQANLIKTVGRVWSE